MWEVDNKVSSELKKFLFLLIIMLLLMVFIPLLPVALNKKENKKGGIIGERAKVSGEGYFYIFDEGTEKNFKIPEKELIYGTVATEMPVSFETEALKAQAVAAYTYFSRAREEFRKKNGEGQAEISVDSKKWKYYVSSEQLKAKWGEKFEERYGKIKNAVDSVFGEVLEDDGNLILAVYHAMSSGETESSKDVFGGEVRYLTNVSSPGDKQAQGYETYAEISSEDFKETIKKSWLDSNFEGDPSTWIKDIEKTQAGTVKSLTVCSHKTTGREIRTMFSLRSAVFDVNYQNGKFIFKVKGYGHGVGMSQYGAQFMAKQGADYKQILSWYYPGTVLVNRLKEKL